MDDDAKVRVRRVRHPVRTLLRALVLVTLVSLQGLAVVGVSLLLLARTSAGQERIRALVESGVQSRIPGFHLGAVHGSWPGEIVFDDVIVDDSSGRPAAHIAEVRARVNLAALLSRRIRLDPLAVAEPQVLARWLGDGRLNFADLVTPGPAVTDKVVWLDSS